MKTKTCLTLLTLLLAAGGTAQARTTNEFKTYRRYLFSNEPGPSIIFRVPQQITNDVNPLIIVRTPRHDSRIDPSMVLAARLAEKNATSQPHLLCWRYVKKALLAAHAIPNYPATVCAREAGSELVKRYGFVKLPITDRYHAPVGSVLVYRGYGPGHVELRTEHGFVSDFRSASACPWELVGVYTKVNG